MRSWRQNSNHSRSVPGFTKNCISICSNSRVRKMKLPGVISFRNALPICAIPNGIFWRDDCRDRKSTRLNSSHGYISYAVFCLKKKNINTSQERDATEGRDEACEILAQSK